MEIVNFMIENYIWFIFGGIVILMVIIGYFAEKTQFGKKPTEKKQKPKKEKPSQVNDVIPSEENLEEVDVETQYEEPTKEAEVPMEEELVNEIVETPEEEVAEETEEPMEDLDAIEIREPDMKEEEIVETEEPEVPEDLYAGLDGTPNAYKSEQEPTSVDDLDLDLPNIDALKDDSSLEEDDIWRF